MSTVRVIAELVNWQETKINVNCSGYCRTSQLMTWNRGKWCTSCSLKKLPLGGERVTPLDQTHWGWHLGAIEGYKLFMIDWNERIIEARLMMVNAAMYAWYCLYCICMNVYMYECLDDDTTCMTVWRIDLDDCMNDKLDGTRLDR